MTRIAPLITRNEQFAAGRTPVALAPPAMLSVILTCLDHRVPPEIVLGMEMGDASVIRNAGGRVTPAVINDIAFLAHLSGQLFATQTGDESLFEVAIIHHTQCGTGFLADGAFRAGAAEALGIGEDVLAESAVDDPQMTVAADVARLLGSPGLSPRISVSGHVYDIATSRITTVLEARYAS